VNPEAGSGISTACLKRVSAHLKHAGVSHETITTDSPDQLVDFAAMASSKGYSGIIAHGGDGTLSHVATGLILSKSTIPLSVIPHGSGNDWARTVGISSLRRTIEAIDGGISVRLDAAECLVRDRDGSNIHSCIFVNSAGIGLDAHVLQRAIVLRRKLRLGRIAYITSLLSTVATMPEWVGKVDVDGETVFEGPYFSITCGVGPYTGGGMRLSPSSTPVDDMLDTTLIRPVSRVNLLKSLPMVYRGSLLNHPAVSSWKGREMVILVRGGLKMELDGEPVMNLPENSSVCLRSIPSAFLTMVHQKAQDL
jgi:diacylglycerol kinase (ATP)